MDIGIIGLPAAGKTSLFRALTGVRANPGRFGGSEGMETLGAAVPDARLVAAATLENSRKTTFAQVNLSDVTGLLSGEKGARRTSAELLGKVRNFDLLIVTLRAFRNDAVPHPLGSVDAARDLGEVESELLLGDLAIIERRIEKIESVKTPPREQKAEYDAEIAVLQTLRAALEEGVPTRDADLDEGGRRRLAQFPFLTARAPLFCLNVEDDQLNEPPPTFMADRRCVTAAVETEGALGDLAEEERREFVEALDIRVPIGERVLRAALEAADKATFFTIGPTESRAWLINRNERAVEAAGKIHKDISRGFIRAEVVSLQDYMANGPWKQLKGGPCVREEGKEYPVQDGDVINVRFSA